MNEELPDELKDISVKDLINDINPKFYKLLSDILKLKVVRVVELCTYLLNFSIQYNYFRWFQVLFKEFPEFMPQTGNPEGMQEYLIGFERLMGMILLLCLKYKTSGNTSNEDTDIRLNKLNLYHPLINKFFIFNTINPKNYKIDLLTLLNVVKPFRTISSYIPDLEFDPDYEPVLNNEALRQTYDTSIIRDYLNSKRLKPLKYSPDLSMEAKFIKAYQHPHERLFDVDSSLTISKFMYKYLNYLGSHFFASDNQIDDIINVFQTYYTKKVPSKKKEILLYLSCFGELLKLCKGRLYFKFRYKILETKLRSTISKQHVNQFLNQFCLKKSEYEFKTEYNQFDPRHFLSHYNRFLSYCMFRISGIAFSGVLLVWRSLIKYLEKLLQEDEFRLIKKGILLENWCYTKAVEYGFDPKKNYLSKS